MEERFLYMVVPRRPIKGIIKGKAILKPTNVQLTKNEVRECLKSGSVYRRFSSSKLERVVVSSVDRFHRSEFISEEAYNKLINPNPVVVVEPTPEPIEETSETTVDLNEDQNDTEEPEVETTDTDEVVVESTTDEEESLEEDKSEVKNVEEEQSDTGSEKSTEEVESEVVVTEDNEDVARSVPVHSQAPKKSKKSRKKNKGGIITADDI